MTSSSCSRKLHSNTGRGSGPRTSASDPARPSTPVGQRPSARARPRRSGPLMGDDVHVDVAGLAHDVVAGPRPEQAANAPGGVAPITSWLALTPAREVQQRGGDVVARQQRGRCRRGSRPGRAAGPGRRGWRADQAVATGDVDGEQVAAGGCGRRSARPRRISVSPSGPPVSATTMRSRAAQVPVDVVLVAVALRGPRRPGRRPTAAPARAGR